MNKIPCIHITSHHEGTIIASMYYSKATQYAVVWKKGIDGKEHSDRIKKKGIPYFWNDKSKILIQTVKNQLKLLSQKEFEKVVAYSKGRYEEYKHEQCYTLRMAFYYLFNPEYTEEGIEYWNLILEKYK